MARKDRRTSHRYTPARDDVCLGWWEGRQFSTVLAKLRNLSTSGALVEVENGRPTAKRVWICLAGLAPIQWVAATVLDDADDSPESGLLRLNFSESFPYEPFKAAVWGEQGGNHAAAAPPAQDLPSTPSSWASEDSATHHAAVSEAQRIRFFLGIADVPGAGEPEAVEDRSRTPYSPHPPTLAQACQAQRGLRDRVAPISWLTIFAISLIVVLSLTLVVATRFEFMRWLSSLPVLGR